MLFSFWSQSQLPCSENFSGPNPAWILPMWSFASSHQNLLTCGLMFGMSNNFFSRGCKNEDMTHFVKHQVQTPWNPSFVFHLSTQTERSRREPRHLFSTTLHFQSDINSNFFLSKPKARIVCCEINTCCQKHPSFKFFYLSLPVFKVGTLPVNSPMRTHRDLMLPFF